MFRPSIRQAGSPGFHENIISMIRILAVFVSPTCFASIMLAQQAAPPPRTEFLVQLRADLEEPQTVGETPLGGRASCTSNEAPSLVLAYVARSWRAAAIGCWFVRTVSRNSMFELRSDATTVL
jgi:hypothetical protein